MNRPIGLEQAFQAAAILAAISVPLLSAVSAIDPLADNAALLRTLGVAGVMFLAAALWSFLELVDFRGIMNMRVGEAAKSFLSPEGALFVGLVMLLVFHVIQTRTLF